MKKRSATGAEALLGAAFAYAFTGVLVREVAPMWGDKAQVAVRWGLVAVILLLQGLLTKGKVSVPKEKRLAVGILSITFTSTVIFFTASVEKTTLANALFVFYAAALVASFLTGSLMLKESVTRTKIAAAILALIGLGFYAGALTAGNSGIILGVLAGAAEGVSNVMRKQLAGVNRSAVQRIQFTVGTIYAATVMLISGEQIVRHVTLLSSFYTVLFAVVIWLAGYLVLYGYGHFDVNIGTVIMSTELVWGALLGLILFHEVPAVHELIGGLFIFGGSVVGSGILDRKTRPAVEVAQPD